MEWSDLFAAVALVLVIEGLLPALNPQGWRETMAHLSQMESEQLRKMGLISMIAGAVLLYLIRMS
ncbi:MAG: DUF2065 domain-containing protein [Gammaproteobacteria bacterium]|jgi:hypothetical protein|nr:DUF2065 domain-containing protein [Gammaproteobacteria bacterium]MBT3489159.1 DUF2065 domain-containing protein [Gammaproteobacteria bacterium]MBT3717578.1 DUF2065 domain-containing protein [Gammaproteobacteria bacterium]MBT3845331.1 DUF2065 domain-containing protein [Gammaproteobacteria bacterium]MBT3892508.1 DUF2065 domain-containing protein [Gammaproteobacteria bacterium]